MTFEIKDYFETPVILEPRVELYTVYDFMGKELPGLAIVLDMPIQGADEKEQFAILLTNQRDIFQHVPITSRKPVMPDSMGVPGFSPFGDVHMSFRIPPHLDARE